MVTDGGPTTPTAMRVAHMAVGRPLLARLRCEVEGHAHVPGSGGVLLCANHRSFLDHFVLASASPRPMRFLGKRQLAEGLAGRMNLALGLVPVDRGRADMSALDTVVQLLREGAVVGVFPEGTRSPDGSLHRFRSGAARIAAAAQVPTVPVALRGTAEVWPRGERPHWSRPRRGVLGVRFLPVMGPPSTDSGRARRLWTERIHAALAEATGQELADGFAPID